MKEKDLNDSIASFFVLFNTIYKHKQQNRLVMSHCWQIGFLL